MHYSLTNALFLASLMTSVVLAQEDTTTVAASEIEDGQTQAPVATGTAGMGDMDMGEDENDLIDETSLAPNPFLTETNSNGVITGQPSAVTTQPTVITTQPDVITTQPPVATEPATGPVTDGAPVMTAPVNSTLVPVMSSETANMSTAAEETEDATETEAEETDSDAEATSTDEEESSPSATSSDFVESDNGAVSSMHLASTGIVLGAAGSVFALFL